MTQSVSWPSVPDPAPGFQFGRIGLFPKLVVALFLGLTAACSSQVTSETPESQAESPLEEGPMARDLRIVELHVEGPTACARTLSGRVACWGIDVQMLPDPACPNTPGERCPIVPRVIGYREPSWLPGLDDTTALALGGYGAAIRESGQVVTWSLQGAEAQELRPIVGLTDAAQISLGLVWGCAIRRNGEVWSWGDPTRFNAIDEEGWNEASQRRWLVGAAQLDTGLAHGCVVTAIGDVTCWNASDENPADRQPGPRLGTANPLPVEGFTDVLEVATGRDLTCLKHRGGRVSCYGPHSPAGDLSDFADIQQIEVSRSWGCLSQESGRLWCWGGALGDDLVEIDGVGDVVDFSLGWEQGCAAASDGSVHCWSPNIDAVGHRVPHIHDARHVAVGQFGCAIRQGGRAACWSFNSAQLPSEVRLPPVPEAG